ncbi:MAG: pyrroline-5-carboxylate reductase [Gammaproteobacteria bacterium]|nr:pyrroline-5-carboxylate reductase [Gammaproteobacteria bacterium]
MKLSVIGYGKFAKALVAGCRLQPGYQFVVSAPSLVSSVVDGRMRTEKDNRVAIQDADVVILCVKPAQVEAVMEDIGARLPQHSVLVSVVTGVSLAALSRFCPPDYPLVRTMPNSPIAIQQGVTGLYCLPSVTSTQKERVNAIFHALGQTYWLEHEADLNKVTALSGSGPAYVFLFLEALVAAGVQLGLNQDLAKSLAIDTLEGSVALAKQSKQSLAQLRMDVTSPGGTTAAALAELSAGNFAELIKKALQAAFERAKELSKTI